VNIGIAAIEQRRDAASLEMAAWADARGFSLVRISEHHGADDGYVPSPLVLAAALAARTTTARLRISALLVPLHDPVRLAEDLAVLDNNSGGRIEVIAAAGYRRFELAMFGVDPATRAQRVTDGVAVLRRAWTGEPFTHEGRTVRVTPRPLQEPGPPVFLGGSTPAAARRAARIADGFVPTDPALYDVYRQACAERGTAPGPDPATPGPSFVHVTDDPERAWATIAPHAVHETGSYAAWLDESGTPGPFSAADLDTIRSHSAYRVVTPEGCLQLIDEGGVGLLVLHPLMGGLDPELAWSSLELFAAEVLPRLDVAPAPVPG